MPDFERTVIVNTEPEDAFRFLADPTNLPRYVATMSFARPEQGDRLRVAAEVQGRHEEGGARFTADPVRRHIKWGAEGQTGYWGRIEVAERNGGSSVHIRVHVEHEHDEREIDRTMDETVSNIERLLGGGQVH